MNHMRTTPVVRTAYLILFTIILAMLIGCSAKEKASAEPEVEVITARFTDPVDLEPQPSDTCIACHTKTNPITKLASPTSAGADTGG